MNIRKSLLLSLILFVAPLIASAATVWTTPYGTSITLPIAQWISGTPYADMWADPNNPVFISNTYLVSLPTSATQGQIISASVTPFTKFLINGNTGGYTYSKNGCTTSNSVYNSSSYATPYNGTADGSGRGTAGTYTAWGWLFCVSYPMWGVYDGHNEPWYWQRSKSTSYMNTITMVTPSFSLGSSNPLVLSCSGASCTAVSAGSATVTVSISAATAWMWGDVNWAVETSQSNANAFIPSTSAPFVVTIGSPDLTAGVATPTTATVGTPASFSSTISNTGTLSTGTSFNNFFQVASAANGGGTIADLASVAMSALAAGGSSTATSPSFSFSTPGTYSVRACADKSSSVDTGVIAESNESNNCGAWGNVVVSGVALPAPTGSISPVANCMIADNASTCTSGVGWLVTNPISPSIRQNSVQFSIAASGGDTRSLNYGSNTFTLYDGATLLAVKTASASCGLLSSWNGSKCAPNPPMISFFFGDPNPVNSGNSTILYWNSYGLGAISCSASASPSNGLWSGAQAASGNSAAIPLTTNTTFFITCTSPYGSSSASDTVTVNAVTPLAPTAVCGNHLCEAGENPLKCPQDCKLQYKQL